MYINYITKLMVNIIFLKQSPLLKLYMKLHLHAEQSQVPKPFLTEVSHCLMTFFAPSLNFLQQTQVIPLLGPQNWMQYSRWGLTSMEWRDRIFYNQMTMLLWMQPKIHAVFWSSYSLTILDSYLLWCFFLLKSLPYAKMYLLQFLKNTE